MLVCCTQMAFFKEVNMILTQLRIMIIMPIYLNFCFCLFILFFFLVGGGGGGDGG